MVTGVSRRAGIGFAIARRLLRDGAKVLIHSFSPHDAGWPSPELRERLRSAFPAGRWGRPDDIAAIVAWLASAESAWMTGQVVDAEGGFRR